jgi:hypothetical protein
MSLFAILFTEGPQDPEISSGHSLLRLLIHGPPKGLSGDWVRLINAEAAL